MPGVETRGLRDLVKHLDALGVAVQDIKDAFTEIGRDAANLASGYAPRRSGKLANSIKPVKSKNKAAVRTSLVYAGAINYGWRKRNIRPSLFMQRASDAIEPRVIPTLETHLARILDANGLS